LLITADGGGSNGSRVRLWKLELQNLANELGFPISVCHFPPGTSKWNKIEHRLFSFISQNWRGRPLSIATFGLFGGLYFVSLSGSEMITKPPVNEFAEKAPPAWIQPEERVPPGQSPGQFKTPSALEAPQEGQI
jgi:hypothetical protein